jgi:hypothetical protein
MPTVSTSPRKAPKARAKKAARKPAAAKTVSARRPSTRSKASRAKGARTRAVHQSEAALRSSQTATKETAGVFGDYAERAVLIPVGAALIARDRVVNSVSDTISTYSSSSKTQAQLKKFERRGATARNRLEREVRKARVRVERQLRQRRRAIESTVSDIEGRSEAIAKNGNDIAAKLQERVLSLV